MKRLIKLAKSMPLTEIKRATKFLKDEVQKAKFAIEIRSKVKINEPYGPILDELVDIIKTPNLTTMATNIKNLFDGKSTNEQVRDLLKQLDNKLDRANIKTVFSDNELMELITVIAARVFSEEMRQLKLLNDIDELEEQIEKDEQSNQSTKSEQLFQEVEKKLRRVIVSTLYLLKNRARLTNFVDFQAIKKIVYNRLKLFYGASSSNKR